jgi:hypothetical protein
MLQAIIIGQRRRATVKVEYAEQYRCACILIEPGDTYEDVVNACWDNRAICDWEGEDDYVVQFPDRPQEVYSADALQRSLKAKHPTVNEPQ